MRNILLSKGIMNKSYYEGYSTSQRNYQPLKVANEKTIKFKNRIIIYYEGHRTSQRNYRTKQQTKKKQVSTLFLVQLFTMHYLFVFCYIKPLFYFSTFASK